MSVILITHHDETIYNVSDKDTDDGKLHKTRKMEDISFKKAQSPQKQAILNVIAAADATQNRHKKQYATMGLPQEDLPNPAEYLKKGSGKPSYSQEETIKASLEKHNCRKREKVFPTKDEIVVYNKKKEEEAKKEKDFITKNIKTVLSMKPKDPERKMVLERHGESKPMTAGLEPIYITQDLLGKAPKYLKKFIKQKEKLRQMKRDTSGVEQPKCKYITREEREILLTGLKHNWAELQMQYQGLPILTDTIPKKNRKSKLESELRQLEKDIVLIERHPYIYVYDDSAPFN